MTAADFAPIVAAATWRAAMQDAGYRCTCTGGCGRKHIKEPGGRCKREHKPWQRLVASPAEPTGDPHKDTGGEQVAYCEPCYDGHLAATKRAARSAAAAHENDVPLFDLDTEGDQR